MHGPQQKHEAQWTHHFTGTGCWYLIIQHTSCHWNKHRYISTSHRELISLLSQVMSKWQWVSFIFQDYVKHLKNDQWNTRVECMFCFYVTRFAQRQGGDIPWRKYKTKIQVEIHFDVTWIHHWKKKGKNRTLTKPLRVRAAQGLSGLALLNVDPAKV